MTEKKVLHEEDLTSVVGGNSYVICGLFQLVQNLGECVVGETIRPGYCKYCKNWKDVIFNGTGTGWGNVHPEKCAIWKCVDCENDNYFVIPHGNLI
ncbi:MAG: hypothetical protein KBT35_07315 [Firmicutes bacterium]|nr:hypothetical protein [Candidatus Colivicinus equi]